MQYDPGTPNFLLYYDFVDHFSHFKNVLCDLEFA